MPVDQHCSTNTSRVPYTNPSLKAVSIFQRHLALENTKKKFLLSKKERKDNDDLLEKKLVFENTIICVEQVKES